MKKRKLSKKLNINKIRTKINNQIQSEKKLVANIFNGTTIGTVVNSNDPQQMGRLQVFCPSLGDISDNPVEDLPWAMYSSPFGGTTSYGSRGPDNDNVEGTVAYGMWAIPKFGAQVLITTLDGNPDYRIWLGCVYGQFLSHTLPSGRYFDKKDENGIVQNDFDGPLASNETRIQPTYKNLEEAFGSKDNNHEWKTRGMENQASIVDNVRIGETNSKAVDDSSRGYSDNKQLTEYGINDSSLYSLTSPGLHSIIMDDKSENCRVKIRSTAGHTILMDDTNERVYISTAKGKNWIELDQAGNIDMYTAGNFSIHAEQDINFTANKSIRMYAKEAIHIKSEDKIKIQADSDMNFKTNAILNMQSVDNMNIKTAGDFKLESSGIMDILASKTLKINTNDTMYLRSSNTTYINGLLLYLNSTVGDNIVVPFGGPVAETAFTTSRIPEHEPWGRISTKAGGSGEQEFDSNILSGLGGKVSGLEMSYDDTAVGTKDRDRTFNRGNNWKR